MTAAAPINTSAKFQIESNHPALPGHFPGAPLVPGVLLLAEGLHRLEATGGHAFRCQRIERAKFLKPVGPGITVVATLNLNAAGQGILSLHVDESLVAQATLVFSLAAGDPADS